MPSDEGELLAGDTVPPFEWRVSRIPLARSNPDLARGALIEFRDVATTGTELRFPFTREDALHLAAQLREAVETFGQLPDTGYGADS